MILNVLDTTNPFLISKSSDKVHCLDLKISTDKTKAYVATSLEELVIFDISDLNNPSKLGNYGFGSIPVIAISKDESKAFITSSNSPEGTILIMHLK